MVYTNLTSTVKIMTISGLLSTEDWDITNVGSDYDITTKVLSYKETAPNKSLNHKVVAGGNILTTINWPTHLTLNIELIADSTTTDITTIINSVGDYTFDTDTLTYSESDERKKHRIALIWNDGADYYMKVYYNAYLVNIIMSDTEIGKFTFNFEVPLSDIRTGNANCYEYEGTNATTKLSTLDTSMGWAS